MSQTNILAHVVRLNIIFFGGCLLLIQSWAWDNIKCIGPLIDDLFDEEVLQGLGFPLARR